MYKRIILGSSFLVLVMGLIFGFCVSFCFAEESITITTYYPSPYGSYNELQTNRLAVGDTNNDGQLSGADQPPANGQLYTARSVIYKPQSSLPAFNAREGELVYNDADDSFYFYNGSVWVRQAAGGAEMTFVGYTAGTDGHLGATGGPRGGNELCNAAFPGSHWASIEEIMKAGSSYPWSRTVWVRNAFVGYGWAPANHLALAQDGNIFLHTYGNPTFTCLGWTWTGTGQYGSSLNTIGGVGDTDCGTVLSLACVESR